MTARAHGVHVVTDEGVGPEIARFEDVRDAQRFGGGLGASWTVRPILSETKELLSGEMDMDMSENTKKTESMRILESPLLDAGIADVNGVTADEILRATSDPRLSEADQAWLRRLAEITQRQFGVINLDAIYRLHCGDVMEVRAVMFEQAAKSAQIRRDWPKLFGEKFSQAQLHGPGQEQSTAMSLRLAAESVDYHRADEERPLPDHVAMFLVELVALQRIYGVSIGHEDGEGGFLFHPWDEKLEEHLIRDSATPRDEDSDDEGIVGILSLANHDANGRSFEVRKSATSQERRSPDSREKP